MPGTPLHTSENVLGTFSQNWCSNVHEETGFHLPATLLLRPSLLASLIECRQGLLDSGDQGSQVAERELRDVTVRMDRAQSLPLNDLPGLVLRETTPLIGSPRDQGFPPRIDESGLRVIDEKA